ncbi:hypothetical protein RF11_07837 [Thelohanellus kitauei]|uniref:Uncharacterized protein n=1 Tax=Thelohanellus kitauei TaxID=669202 RepID=A0A0C2MJT0_THEKT|nr:hypothetical protein RF11_07837 [Thelohanellus kitauei]
MNTPFQQTQFKNIPINMFKMFGDINAKSSNLSSYQLDIKNHLWIHCLAVKMILLISNQRIYSNVPVKLWEVLKVKFNNSKDETIQSLAERYKLCDFKHIFQSYLVGMMEGLGKISFDFFTIWKDIVIYMQKNIFYPDPIKW